MTSHSDVDLLIATLHPHVLMGLFNSILLPPPSLKPSDLGPTEVRQLVQVFATLFSFYPGCDAAAVTAKARRSGDTSLYICLSPSTPNGFDKHVDQWLTQFMAIRQESKSSGGVQQPRQTLSQSEKCFILDVYCQCYPAMRARSIAQALGDWNIFIDAPKPATDMLAPKPTEEEERLRREYKDPLQQLSQHVHTYVSIISCETIPQDEDMLKFHELCLAIRDIMKSDGFSDFLQQYVYTMGIDLILEDLCLPIELSTLLDQSRSPCLALDGNWSSHIVDPSAGSRQFNAAVTKTNLIERFGSEVTDIKWDNVVRAVKEFTEKLNPYGDNGGAYEWNANENLLSTRQCVTVHPDITLIHHLVENTGEREAEAYIACSRTPCYASVLYTGAMNRTLEPRKFAMRVDHPDWCRLYTAKPWILPKAATPEVVAHMKEHLLRDLKKLIQIWVKEKEGSKYSGYTKK